MGSKLFVGNLSFQMNDSELEEVFKECGEVVSAKIIFDRRTGRSKGFGFVEMKDEDQAKNAQEALNGVEVKERPINVSFAREQSDNRDSSDRGGFSKRNNYSEF